MAKSYFTYPYKHPNAKAIASKIARQCRPLEKLYTGASFEKTEQKKKLGLPHRGIGWVKVVGPGLVNVAEGIWAVKVECWVGEGPFFGSVQAARILIHPDRNYSVESTPKFPEEMLKFFERRQD